MERTLIKMSGNISSLAPKRTYKEFMAEELAGKLRSKRDFYVYLDKHCKYIIRSN